jgi:hypothetical protein
MRKRWAGYLAFVLFALFSSHVLAIPPEDDKKSGIAPYVAAHYGAETINWQEGQFINLCTPHNGKCQSVKMPRTLGKVERVLEGPFISSARASWLAFTKFETFVCAALKMRTTVVCARTESNSFPIESVDFRVGVTPDNRTRISLIGKKVETDNDKLAKLSGPFKRAVWESANILQGEVDMMAAGTSSFSSSLAICDKDPRHPGPAPHPDCEIVEEGGTYMWSCPVIGMPPAPGPDDPVWPEPEPIDPDPCS